MKKGVVPESLWESSLPFLIFHSSLSISFEAEMTASPVIAGDNGRRFAIRLPTVQVTVECMVSRDGEPVGSR